MLCDIDKVAIFRYNRYFGNARVKSSRKGKCFPIIREKILLTEKTKHMFKKILQFN